MTPLTNLQRIKSSRRAPVRGDTFAMLLPTATYLFGRVILVESQQGPMPGANLLYIYAYQSKAKAPDEACLRPNNLLIPPVWTNRLGWTKGLFETIGSGMLKPTDLLPQHCFRRHDYVYLDETGRRLRGRVEPCGEWGLVSYRWIDDHVSDALGIPRVPESPED
ncbi:hypothetical protein C2U70_24240 [Bradyrhizobium guangdongense]|uniref:Imm26 family immunity protein n=1 Tax=Bradyrhizobium guangdongense TaxID=1325090 RepID=UPI001129963E|nr:Imm26 family immunity protein [Bradyrhizobium guangdongense]TPQ31362.1 hypothetical protein C2U70_24240 [Bradyrhizobium guangdongense]